MEIEGESAEECAAVSLGGGCEVVLGTFGFEKGVDGGICGEILKGLPCPVTEAAVFLGGEDEGKQAKK